MSLNDRLLEATGTDFVAAYHFEKRERERLEAERDELRRKLTATSNELDNVAKRNITLLQENGNLYRQVEDLRAEAFWHAKAAGEGGQIIITLSLESLRRVVASLR